MNIRKDKRGAKATQRVARGQTAKNQLQLQTKLKAPQTLNSISLMETSQLQQEQFQITNILNQAPMSSEIHQALDLARFTLRCWWVVNKELILFTLGSDWTWFIAGGSGKTVGGGYAIILGSSGLLGALPNRDATVTIALVSVSLHILQKVYL